MRADSKEETVASVKVRDCRSVVFDVSAVAVVLSHIQNVGQTFLSPFSSVSIYRSLFSLAVWSIADVLLVSCRDDNIY